MITPPGQHCIISQFIVEMHHPKTLSLNVSYIRSTAIPVLFQILLTNVQTRLRHKILDNAQAGWWWRYTEELLAATKSVRRVHGWVFGPRKQAQFIERPVDSLQSNQCYLMTKLQIYGLIQTIHSLSLQYESSKTKQGKKVQPSSCNRT